MERGVRDTLTGEPHAVDVSRRHRGWWRVGTEERQCAGLCPTGLKGADKEGVQREPLLPWDLAGPGLGHRTECNVPVKAP